MKKSVWIVHVEGGKYDDYCFREIHSVCETEAIAKTVRADIKKRIKELHKEYEARYNTAYEDDLRFLNETLSINKDAKRYNDVVKNIFEFKLEYRELSFENIIIEEHNLISQV